MSIACHRGAVTFKTQTGRGFAGVMSNVDGGRYICPVCYGGYSDIFDIYRKHTQNRTNIEKKNVENFATNGRQMATNNSWAVRLLSGSQTAAGGGNGFQGRMGMDGAPMQAE